MSQLTPGELVVMRLLWEQGALLSRWIEAAAGAPWTIGVLSKLTLLFAAAWALHAALARSNPRWRVLLWRGSVAAALIVVFLSLAGPAISLTVLPPVIENASVQSAAIGPAIVEPPVAVANVTLATESKPPIASDTPAASSRPIAAASKNARADGPLPPDHSAAALRAWTFTEYLWIVWGIGLLIGGLRESIAIVRLGRLRRRAVIAAAPIVAQAADIAVRLNLRKSFEVLMTDEIASPCVIGLRHAAILLPAVHDRQAAGDELTAVLAHEIQHLKNGDLPWNTLLRMASRLLWFHPLLWRVRSAHAAACDAVCDAAAADFMGDMAAYCRALARLALRAAAPTPETGLAMARASSVRRRIEALHRRLYASCLPRWAMRIAILTGLVATGLLGSTSLIRAQAGDDAQPVEKAAPPVADFTIAGHCYLWEEQEKGKDGAENQPFKQTPLPKTHVTLYVASALTDPAEKVAETTADEKGRFEFTGLLPPRSEMHFDRRAYGVVARAEGHPPSISLISASQDPKNAIVLILPKSASLLGKVVNQKGQPVAGATIDRGGLWSCVVPGVQSAVTDRRGHFTIPDLALPLTHLTQYGHIFRIRHPDYPQAEVNVAELPAGATFTLPTGCILRGVVRDRATGKPAAGATVTAESNKDFNDVRVITDASGRYRLVVAEGNYNILAEAKDRVGIASTNQECDAGQAIELAPIELTRGGWIVGQVKNSVSGEPIPNSKYGPVVLGLFGPAYPPRTGSGVSPLWLAAVDRQGRFRLQAAAGNNYPYFVNETGKRMAWDTLEQPAIVVKEGQTVEFDMLVDPVISPEEKMNRARKVIARLPQGREQRVAAILTEMHNVTLDDLELWCLLMREVITIGPEAVPQLCAELDRTDKGLSWLGFALRAIGDRRAVPALIRAIPKTLQPPSSDFGFEVADADLMAFMKKHDLEDIGFISVGRPVQEIFGALHQLTGQDMDDQRIFPVMRADDPNSVALQQRLYRRQAERWRHWWETHWQELIADEAYAKVNLPAEENAALRPILALGPKSALGESSGDLLSPPGESGQQFLDLDTGLQPKWPADIPQNEAAALQGELALWAAHSGVDLMCVTYRSANGKPTYALRSFNMRLWEISRRDAEEIEKWVKGGKLPEGQPVGELLLHQDKTSGHYANEENAAFLYLTREGGAGVITVTDRVTRVAETPAYSGPLKGTGPNKGVRFDYTPIVP